MTPEPVVHCTLDVRTTEPALVWPKTKLRLEKLSFGERLAVQVLPGTDVSRIPDLAQREGHRVLEVRVVEGALEIILERGRQNFTKAFLGR